MNRRLNLPDLEILMRMLASIIILEHTTLRGVPTNRRRTPRLTLGCNPMPCLSSVGIPRRCSIIVCADYPDAAWTGAVLMHSPKLPQFSTVQLEPVPWTILDSN